VSGDGHRPRKRFGQNFLHDPYYIGRIVDAIAPRPGDCIVEIGPGLGALTGPLLEQLDHLHAVEIDRDLIARLEARYPRERLTVHAGDALAFDFASLPAPLRVVGNLPYNISTPILFHLASFADRLIDGHFMLQREVVERMVAAPDTPEYGRLSVALQARFEMDKVFLVPGGAFNPPPKVESAIVRMVPKRPPVLPASLAARFDAVVTRAFTMRRKTLRNSLAGVVPPTTLAALGIDPQRRAETLGYADFIAIAAHP
jgi:16S rRNA (adenine1518-N6/adenine1519-N6)-dimethyltransferase